MSPTMAPRGAKTPPMADEAPVLPHELAIAALLRNADEAAWKIPSALSARLPFATFALGVHRASPKASATLELQCALPCPEPTAAECSRYRIPAGVPRYVVSIPEATWSSAVTLGATYRATLASDDALALLVGEHLADVSSKAAPSGRPFVVPWVAAIAALATVTCNMHWQAMALVADRDAVHRTRSVVREYARQLDGAWGKAIAGEVR